jgi:hypothetical protein
MAFLEDGGYECEYEGRGYGYATDSFITGVD